MDPMVLVYGIVHWLATAPRRTLRSGNGTALNGGAAMAFDSDLRMLLRSIAKASRKPFQNIGVQAQKRGRDECPSDEQPTIQPLAAISANKVARKP
jgi:hypothetical protein